MSETSSWRSTLLLLAILLALLAFEVVRLRGPAPEPANAAASRFSALRAQSSLRNFLGGDVPHPVGSPAHDAVRERVAAQFRALGYDVAIEHRFACSPEAVCAPVDNIVASVPGQASGDTLAVCAHYDSVAAGPGASDDGIGVAALLEIARAVRTEPMRNRIIFLITDGEEVALLGAEGFVADRELAASVRAVINVEDRGTSGPSFMFETSRHNRWLVPVIARALERPAATSLFNSIYDLLPNDTDVSVFKREGLTAVNFAAIGDVGHYHTPNDNLANVNLRTLQHHGDNLLAMTRALGGAELRQLSDVNGVFFDVLTLTTVWWPQGWSLWLAIVALVLVIVAAWLRVREDEATANRITIGVLGFFASLLAAGVLGVIAVKIALIRGAAVWIAHPEPLIVAMWMAGLAASMAVAILLRRRANFDELFLGNALCWCAAAIVMDRLLSGGAYLFLVPAMTMAVLAIVRAVVDVRESVVVIVSSVAAMIVVAPIALYIYIALGTGVLPGVAVIVALIVTSFAPAMPRRVLVAVPLAIAVVCIVATWMLPLRSRDWPARVQLSYVAHDGVTEWMAPLVIGSMRDVAKFGAQPKDDIYTAPAPDLHLAPPELTVVRDETHGKRTLVLHARSLRGAHRIAIAFKTAATVDAVRVNGVVPPPKTGRRGDTGFVKPERVVVWAPEADIELTTRGARPIDVTVSDYTFGLPAEGAAIAKARDAAFGTTTHEGDLTIVRVKKRL